MVNKVNRKRNPAWYITACFLLFLALILFLGYTVKKYSDGIYQNIRESTTESVEALTSDRVKMLDKTLNLLETQAQALAIHLSEPKLTVTPDMLKTFAKMRKEYLFIGVFNSDGAVVSSGGTSAKISSNDEVYRQVFAGKSGVTDTFLGEMGYEEVRVYAPIYQRGVITGGVYIDLDAEILRSAGESSLYDSAGYSYLLKQDGTILLAPSFYSYAQIYHNVRDVFAASKSNQKTVEALMNALKKGERGNAVLEFSGEMQILCFEPSAVKEGWYYVSVLPLALVENNGQTVIRLSSRMIALFLGFVLAFFVFLGVILFVLLRDKWKQETNEGRVYKAISENIDTAIFIMDQHTHRIRHVFENMRSILGIPAEKVQGNICDSQWLTHIGLPAEVIAMVEEVELSSQPVTAELKYNNPHLGKEVWLSVSVSPLNLKGRKEYMVAFTDITENKNLMEQLHASMLEAQSSNEAKSSFLANMSHDIRTPMNAITGMTDIAIRSIEDRERVLDCLNKITLSSNHLKGLINDILDMSKIESGKLTLNAGITSLPEVMEGLVNIIQFQADEKEQQLLVVIQHVEHETVLCDAVRLNQVLMNILANAVKFTPNKGSIRCTVEETFSPRGAEYGRYLFTVKDNGIGMSKELQETIFDAFTREKSSRIEKIEGSGLGMSISKWIVDQMGGTIQVSSQLGRGSEFLVTLDFPVSGQPIEVCGLEQGLSLLLIDRDEQSSQSAASTLETLRFLVDTACDTKKALEFISHKHEAGCEYDVILLNHHFSKEDLFASIARIHEAARRSIIIVAGANDSEIGKQVEEEGADAVISPLFFKSTLSREITRVLLHRADEPTPLPTDKPLEACHVLMAEDNELNREIAVELLSSSGALVDTAEDGYQCLERFLASEAGYYQMILMDIRMPVMNGYEAARQIRSSARADAEAIPILAVTADAFSEDIQAAKDAGMNGHISKPLDMVQVIAEMKRCLSRF